MPFADALDRRADGQHAVALAGHIKTAGGHELAFSDRISTRSSRRSIFRTPSSPGGLNGPASVAAAAAACLACCGSIEAASAVFRPLSPAGAVAPPPWPLVLERSHRSGSERFARPLLPAISKPQAQEVGREARGRAFIGMLSLDAELRSRHRRQRSQSRAQPRHGSG